MKVISSLTVLVAICALSVLLPELGQAVLASLLASLLLERLERDSH